MIKNQLKRLVEEYFRVLARIKERYAWQKAMRTNFHARYVVRSMDFGNVFLDTMSFEDDCLAKFGIFEPRLHDIFKTFIAAHSVVLDIGANSGLHSLLFSNILRHNESPTRADGKRPDGKVYSFEPASFNYRALCRNLSLNDSSNIEPINMAVSVTTGTANMFMIAEGGYWQGRHSLVKNEKLSSISSVEARVKEIPTITIDQFLAERDEQLPVSFIKIDVEGAEHKVLRGAVKTIEQHKPVLVIEFAVARVQFLSTSPDTYCDLINKGYRAFAIFHDGSMWEVDSISNYVTRGTLSDDPDTEKRLARRKSNELLFVPEEQFQHRD